MMTIQRQNDSCMGFCESNLELELGCTLNEGAHRCRKRRQTEKFGNNLEHCNYDLSRGDWLKLAATCQIRPR